ncbi:hypothetical protein L195_g043584, partial [Trifolium pratense]
SKWNAAMKEELHSIEKNHTWKLVELPPQKKAISVKWMFKLKKDPDGKIVKHKARLVARGFLQQEGIDYTEVYAPVARIETIRLVIAIVSSYNWSLYHMDVKSAFLNGPLEEEVYVLEPPGFEIESEKNKGSDMKMITRHNSRANYKTHNVASIEKFKGRLKNEFEMSDLGKLNYFLELEFHYVSDGIVLHQRKYIADVLKRFHMENCNEVETPMEANLKLSKSEDEQAVDATLFKQVVGSLRFICNTRPDSFDISFDCSKKDPEILEGRSTGYWFRFRNSPISWSSKKQNIVALFSCEADYVKPMRLNVDNKSAISLAKNPIAHGRSKHIETKYHFLRDQVNKEKLTVVHRRTNVQVEDILTKSLRADRFKELRNMLGIVKAERLN